MSTGYEKQVGAAFLRVENAIADSEVKRSVDNLYAVSNPSTGPYAKAYDISFAQLYTAGTAGFLIDAAGYGFKLRKNGATPNAIVQATFTYQGAQQSFLMYPGDKVLVPYDKATLRLVWPANATGSMANAGAASAAVNAYAQSSFVRPVVLQNGMDVTEDATFKGPGFLMHALADTSDTGANARASVSGLGTWDGLSFYPYGFSKIHVWVNDNNSTVSNNELLVTPVINQAGSLSDQAFKINPDGSGYFDFVLDATALVQAASGTGLPYNGTLTSPNGANMMLSIQKTSDSSYVDCQVARIFGIG